jgi:hypothetical protein
MVSALFRVTRRHLAPLALGLVALLTLLLPLAPVHAATPPEASPAWEALRQELSGLQSQSGVYSVQQARRLADLSRLESAIADPSERPTLENGTAHNLGVFVRGKRQAPDQPADFAVLAAGHQTDDDVETVALYIPANVPVSWPGRQPEAAATPARVARLLPGEQLRVSDGEGGKGYRLSLPAVALDTDSADLAALPALSQDGLDTQPETAPVD